MILFLDIRSCVFIWIICNLSYNLIFILHKFELMNPNSNLGLRQIECMFQIAKCDFFGLFIYT